MYVPRPRRAGGDVAVAGTDMSKPAPVMRTLRIVTGETPLTSYGEGDDGECKWEARCLEMSLSGFGPTPLAAEEHLFELMAAQVEFAFQENTPEIITEPDEELIAKYPYPTNEAEE